MSARVSHRHRPVPQPARLVSSHASALQCWVRPFRRREPYKSRKPTCSATLDRGSLAQQRPSCWAQIRPLRCRCWKLWEVPSPFQGPTTQTTPPPSPDAASTPTGTNRKTAPAILASRTPVAQPPHDRLNHPALPPIRCGTARAMLPRDRVHLPVAPESPATVAIATRPKAPRRIPSKRPRAALQFHSLPGWLLRRRKASAAAQLRNTRGRASIPRSQQPLQLHAQLPRCAE